MGDSQPPQLFSVRLVSIDYYMAPPIPAVDISYSTFHGGKVNEVPVIRIYGSTPSGQKTCLHVHRALPYLYIPCSDLGFITNNEVDSCTHSLSLALEKALKLKGNAGSKRQHVHGCDLVRARKFYGYHSSEELFVKIYFYHPQDVSRAANLLLAGAVLDKNLQPHESHIPFLLQFMIDYNLYGMGHLHVSKMKFRYPVPDAFSQRKAKHNGQPRPYTDDSTCMDPQPDLVGDLCPNMPIWISSTIPDGWIWQYSHQPDSSTNDDISLFRRHSTTELEGDAVIDDIINHQFISYGSLSQSHSEVKMVQSLIPIWEEEYDRNGVPEAIPPDPKKKSPLDALRVLSDGVEFEKVMEVRNDAESGSLLTPESTASPDCGDLIASGLVNFANKYLKASDKSGSLLSLDLSFQNVDAAESNEMDAGDTLQTPDTMDLSSAKATDGDALSLLKWLASSQAAEDINSDDELARETILSPLLLSKDIDKVLERANVDYESESQKECQDILDSIDMVNSEELEGRSLNSAEYNHYSKAPNKRIPQLDGSSDDLCSTPCSNESLKPDISEAKRSVEVPSWPELDSDLICEPRRKKPRWGPLPIASQKLSDLSHPNTSSILTVCDNGKKGSIGTSSCANEAERIPIVAKVTDKKDVSYTEQDSIIADCSTRDLMRRKRSRRFDLSECRNLVEDWKTELCSYSGCEKGVINLDPNLSHDIQDKKAFLSRPHKSLVENEATQCHESINSPVDVCNEARNVPKNENPVFVVRVDSRDNCQEYLQGGVGHESSSHVTSCTPETIHEDSGCRVLQTDYVDSCIVPSECDLLSKTTCVSTTRKLPDSAHEDMKGIESETTLTQLEKSSYCGGNPSFSEVYDPLKNVNKEVETVKLITMTFSKKPPTIEWTEDPRNETPLSFANGESKAATSHQVKVADNYLPFFMSNCSEQERQGLSPRKSECTTNHESAMGVPTLYQNDGSHLLMLTHAMSPPSRESVERWMSFHGSDTLSKKLDESSPFVPILKVFSCDMVDSQGSQANFSSSPLQESGSGKPNFNKIPETKLKSSTVHSQDISQISGPDKGIRLTPLSQIGFRDPASVGQGQQLTLLSIEVLAECRGDLRPDPRFDPINVIVLVVQEDDESILDIHVLLRCESANVGKDLDAVSECKIFVFTEELQLFNHFIKVIRASDPDVLMGWDVQSGSLGFLAERASYLGLGLLNNISRTPSETNVASGNSRASEKEIVKEMFSESTTAEAVNLENAIIEDEWGRTHASGVHVGGRIVLNIWRLMRNEVKLNMYTAESVAETVLRRKIPHIPYKVLKNWFSSGPGRARYRSIDYTLERAKLNLQIMNQLDMINRTSELARVFGIDFFSVLSRGSQYRVESMFLRLAHTQNYLAISPGTQQVANQPAMECLPLVMEPESNFYVDPVIVLDFQSLYPSMVIAYNLCFCTCLGKITPQKENILGVSSYSPDTNVFCNLKRELLVTPNGVVYMPSKVRQGILPRLLQEILSTRIMVKQAMKKLTPSQQVLHRILNARQLALKLIANVTYGYTAAGFSGRMPCAELADSIVQCGRRTLETAISFVNSNDMWKARVVYGDTDSMFVLLKGRSVKEAFAIGREIASAITEMNPDPVTLKMEKVYYPCFLLTKKRYVGYSYESPDQSKPIFDAKGIETVRRDTCEAVSKTMEQSLRVYFESQGIDKVKEYIIRQWKRILSGRISLKDFIFAKEVRLGTYSARASSLPPAAIVATKSMRFDPRAEPRYAERVPYVVVHGEPGARLVDMVVDPHELLSINSPFRLNDIYYIRKQIIPALQRVFGLVGADLNRWFLEMPRPGRESVGKRRSVVANPQRTRIDYYYASQHCVVCGELVQGSAHVCHDCCKNETTVAVALTGMTSKLEKDMHHLAAICGHCGGGDWRIESGVKCISLSCSVFYERKKVEKELQSLSQVATTSGFYPKFWRHSPAPMAYLLCTTFFTPISHRQTQFQGTDTRRMTGRGLINPITYRTAKTHVFYKHSDGGRISPARSSFCSIYVTKRQYVEPILCHFGSHLLITGFWVGPDIEDGWGFVEAFIDRIC